MSLAGKHVNVGMMTSGGLAPCLSCSISKLMKYWIIALKEGKISGLTFRMYFSGYKGLLTGDSVIVPESEWDACEHLNTFGGSPIGNSRVKLTNTKDCVKNGFVKEGENPLEVASQQLIKDKIDVLHTIGGDDTSTQAAKLSKFLFDEHGGKVLVVGMPKTIDNDVVPVKQSFGAQTAACQGAIFFKNVVNECTANPRMLILHEVMGRDCGYLTAATAYEYRKILTEQNILADSVFLYNNVKARDVHAIWIPEMELDMEKEGKRLKKIMDTLGCVNIFFGEGTGVKEIIAKMEADGEVVPRDAFGHVSLQQIRPGEYFSAAFSKYVDAGKYLVQRSGYFSRSAAANEFDQDLIGRCAEAGVAAAIDGISGLMGEDEEKEGFPIRPLEFERVKGAKPFDVSQEWFQQMLKDIGQIE